MTPGSVVFHTKFPFRDSETPGKKLAVILNDGSGGRYIAVKTTSQGRMYTWDVGCQPPPSNFPCYFVPGNASLFPKDTWIQLNDFFSFDVSKFRDGQRRGIILPKLQIPNRFLLPLIKCTLKSDDLTRADEKILISTLEQVS